MLAMTTLWLTLALAAPGEIYRCKDASGTLSYQDHPCARASSETKLASAGDSAASQRELQQWLDSYRRRSGGSIEPSTTVRRPSAAPYTGGAVSEAQLAVCSERFLHCAHGDEATMDRCVDGLPRCGDGRGNACCPQVCVDRYQYLRQAGQPLASAVRLALLDPEAPACGAVAGG